jgi:hypothetical protein
VDAFGRGNLPGTLLEAEGADKDASARSGVDDAVCQCGNPFLVLLRSGVSAALDDHESFAVNLHTLAVDLPVGRGTGTGDVLLTLHSLKVKLKVRGDLIEDVDGDLFVGLPRLHYISP